MLRGSSGFRRVAGGGIVLFPVAAVALGIAVAQHPPDDPDLFTTSDNCMACHNGLSTPGGEDVSIGFTWRASMMANSARDPYWQAAVRREIMDFPASRASIENECSRCHMPMANETARAAGRLGEVFVNLPIGGSAAPAADLAADGVSCTVCHQIEPDNLGTPESFTGNFVIDRTHPWEQRRVFGPFAVDSGRVRLMRSATAFEPTEANHLQQSEMCATCHTLYTHALGAGGVGIQLPEQTPYQEWTESDFAETRSCQGCHMPVVPGSTAVSSVLGQPREGVSRHVFLGGNFFMIRMLNRYRQELGVVALPQEMEAAAARTAEHLRAESAELSIDRVSVAGGTVEAVVSITNKAGHKLPTAYPSRRAWIEVRVTDRAGRVVYSSGALRPDGSIAGNDNDRDGGAYEPHHEVITSPDEVQVYESVMGGPSGEVTTGLLTAVGYLKDNRLLPVGFDKTAAHDDVAVRGSAMADADFLGGSDRITYRMNGVGENAPFTIEAFLWYQPIGFRWANNLGSYDSPETNRFVRYYESMSEGSAIILAQATATAG